MASTVKKQLTRQQADELISVLQTRFTKHAKRHKNIKWDDVQLRLQANPDKLWSLHQMEATGGEPDVIGKDEKTGSYIFCDCSAETPTGRRSICYDRDALDSRKENKPAHNAMDFAHEMGIEMLDEDQYRALQDLEPFDTKTSSWLKTPSDVRKLGGALFGDFRYGRVFTYHNGASSYYAARGFRGMLTV